ncbi:MAG: hypothetical protein LUE89_09020 [Clostridiales bacterium]|nr:hypothetical protein [Clostridiales bacterium]
MLTTEHFNINSMLTLTAFVYYNERAEICQLSIAETAVKIIEINLCAKKEDNTTRKSALLESVGLSRSRKADSYKQWSSELAAKAGPPLERPA